MLLKFDFVYESENDFFEYLLNFYAKNLTFCVERGENRLILKAQGDENELKAFCDSFESLPNSVFVRDFNVKVLENESLKPSETRQDFAKKDFLTSLNSSTYQEKGALIENEWGEFVCESLCFDESANFEPITKANFNELLDKSLDILSKGRTFFVKNALGICEVGLFKSEFLNSCDFAKENSRQNSILPPNSQEKFLMATEIKALKTAFVCSNDNLKLLASLEKPLIKLRFSAIFRQNRGLKINEFKVKLPHNLFFFALGARLFERGENFLAFTRRENSEDEFELYECEKRLVVLRGLSFINKRARELILSKDDKNMARISYILSRFKKSALLLELSQSYDDILLIDKERNMLNLSLPRSAGQIYADICADEVGKRLFDNFKLNFQLLSGEFELKNNFFSLLGLVGLTLGLGKTVKTAALRVLELSDATKIPRGVKIDYRYKENSKEFDYTRTLRSAMSFMLAGVEAENIAYGAVESLSFFLRDFYDELREKKLVEIAIISGSLFESKALTKNTLKHLKDCKVSDVPLWI